MSRIQVYGFGSPNGVKIPIALEEMGLAYDAHIVNIRKGEQFETKFKKISPNSKIPIIVDPDGPEGEMPVMESGAIMYYLAEKSGRLLPEDVTGKNEVLQWLFFQVGSIGPMFGSFGHFHSYAKDKCDHPYPVERYAAESRKLLSVLDKQLKSGPWIIGDMYTIADISIFPWLLWVDEVYNAANIMELFSYPNVTDWVKRCKERPESIKGLEVFGFGPTAKT